MSSQTQKDLSVQHKVLLKELQESKPIQELLGALVEYHQQDRKFKPSIDCVAEEVVRQHIQQDGKNKGMQRLRTVLGPQK